MTIAVHISAGKHEDLSDNFNFVCFSELAEAHPESHFIFTFDRQPHPELYLEPNCTPVIISPSLKNNMLRHYWYNYKLPGIIQRYNAGIFITSGLTCSLRLEIPQCLVVSPFDLVSAAKNLYLKKFVPAFLKKASHIFTIDNSVIHILQNKYNIADKVTMLFPGFKNDSTPLSYEDRKRMKNELTSGDEYFLFVISAYQFEKLKTVLKAFSIFKKWQKSSMRLALLVNAVAEQSIVKELALYKYRKDISIFKMDTDTQNLVRAAYGILADSPEIFNTTLPALQSGVPVMINEKYNMQKVLPGALHVSWHEKDIAANMMNLYKDEHMRSEAIHMGIETAAKYSWKNTTEKIWQALQNLLN